LHENEIATKVLDAAFVVHTELGPGLLETVYEAALAFELIQMGFVVQRQYPIPVLYRGVRLEQGFRAELIVESKVIVEIKALEVVPQVAYRVLLTYLRFGDLRLGILINFNESQLKDGIKRAARNL